MMNRVYQQSYLFKNKALRVIQRLSAYRAVNTLHFGYKSNLLMMCKAVPTCTVN